MADLYVDVHLELDPAELARQHDPSRYALELSRHVAEDKCAEAHAQLRTDQVPDVVIGRGLNAVTGDDTVLCSSRWAVIASDALARTI